MLPSKQKIDRKSFPSFKDKKFVVWTGKSLRISCFSGKERHQQFAVVVSKKQYKTHVHRNYFKRVIFECIRHNKDKFSRISAQHIVFHPMQAVESITNEEIFSEVGVFLSTYASKGSPN